MKTFRIFFAALFVLFLHAGNTSAQDNKSTYSDSWEWSGAMPCTNDYVTGTETINWTSWDGKLQIRYKGSYTGVSGKTYTWSRVENRNVKNFTEGEAFSRTYVTTNVIECEGVPVAITKYRYHMTLNANGELTVQRLERDYDWICL